MLGLEGTGSRHTEVSRLFLGEGGQFNTDVVQVKFGDLLVELENKNAKQIRLWAVERFKKSRFRLTMFASNKQQSTKTSVTTGQGDPTRSHALSTNNRPRDKLAAAPTTRWMTVQK